MKMDQSQQNLKMMINKVILNLMQNKIKKFKIIMMKVIVKNRKMKKNQNQILKVIYYYKYQRNVKRK